MQFVKSKCESCRFCLRIYEVKSKENSEPINKVIYFVDCKLHGQQKAQPAKIAKFKDKCPDYKTTASLWVLDMETWEWTIKEE